MAKNPHAVALGKLGGAAKSDKKRKASAENGRKGGAPRKQRCPNCDGGDPPGRRCRECRRSAAASRENGKKGGRPKKQKPLTDEREE